MRAFFLYIAFLISLPRRESLLSKYDGQKLKPQFRKIICLVGRTMCASGWYAYRKHANACFLFIYRFFNLSTAQRIFALKIWRAKTQAAVSQDYLLGVVPSAQKENSNLPYVIVRHNECCAVTIKRSEMRLRLDSHAYAPQWLCALAQAYGFNLHKCKCNHSKNFVVRKPLQASFLTRHWRTEIRNIQIFRLAARVPSA